MITGENHECGYIPDGSSSLELLWQWSRAAEDQENAAESLMPSFAGFPMGTAETGSLLLAVNYVSSHAICRSL